MTGTPGAEVIYDYAYSSFIILGVAVVVAFIIIFVMFYFWINNSD